SWEILIRCSMSLVETGEQRHVRLLLGNPEAAEFVFQIQPRPYVSPCFALVGAKGDEREERKDFHAKVHLKEGGQDYDVMGFAREQLIGDVLDQYERLIHYMNLLR